MERCEVYLSEESVQELMRRLSRIEGQVKGIRRMLEEGRSCDEILIQMSAVKSAISSMAMFLLEEHFNSCVKPSVESGNVKALEDFMRAVRQLVKGG